MAQWPISAAASGSPAVPALPARPPAGRRRSIQIVLGLVLFALLVYSWLDTSASVAQFVSGTGPSAPRA